MEALVTIYRADDPCGKGKQKGKKMRKLKVKITLTEPMLGTKSANEELFTKFIAGKRPEGVAADEAEAERRMNEECDEREKSMTCFHRTDDGTPMLWDYQVKGFFKDACGALRTVPKTESGKLKAYKKIIDGQIFVDERRIPLVLPEGGEIGICERPLRAQTMQGERVALAKSESVPAGTTFEITITMLDPSMEDVVREWLDYGALRGIGQWRNSGMGRIKWEEVK